MDNTGCPKVSVGTFTEDNSVIDCVNTKSFEPPIVQTTGIFFDIWHAMVRAKSPRFMLETVLNVNFYNPVSCWSIRMWHGDVINVSKSSYFPPYQWTESTFHWHMQLQELLKEQRSIKAEFFSSSADSFKGKDLSWKEERIERKCLWLMGGKTVLAIREATISHRVSKRSSERSRESSSERSTASFSIF